MTVAKLEAKSKRKALLYPGEDGYFVVEVPSFPSCISQGKTREEAIANIEEAIDLYIEVLQDRGEPISEDMVVRSCWYEQAACHLRHRVC
jgi:predicted RNase H-like HicB family nuclease